MIGDNADMAARLRSVLPARWFGDSAPLLDALLTGVGEGWAAIYALVDAARTQARIASATGGFLDLISSDFFGSGLARRTLEADAAFRVRIGQELLRPRATRAALVLAVTELTGRAPRIFEPARTSDTGGYSVGGVGYGSGGGWGSLQLPYQVFVTAFRPAGGGIAELAGYGTAGVAGYGDLSMVTTVVSDADIQETVTNVLPAATIAWMNIAG